MSRRIGIVACAVVALLFGARPAHADALFERCTGSTGRAYVEARDQWLQSQGALPGGTAEGDWRRRSTAMILQAWKTHAAMYRAYTAPAERADYIDKADAVLLARPSRIPTEAIPLLYEYVLKHTAPHNIRQLAAQALVYQHRHGHALDVALLREALADRTNSDAADRNIVAGLLAALPANAVAAEDLQELLSAELSRTDPHMATAIALLDGIVSKGQTLDVDQRNALSESLVRLKAAPQIVGPLRFAYAIGDLGGSRGVALAAELLAKTAVPRQQRWALDALGRAGTPDAAEHLVAFAQETTRPRYLRRRAIDNAHRCDIPASLRETVGRLEAELR